MKHLRFLVGAAALALIGTAAQAQFSVLVDESSITAITGGDAAPEDIAVDGSGNIIVVDEGVSGNEMVLRFDSAGGNGVLITDEQSIIAAIDAANGAFGAPSAFTINSVFVAADGDLVLTNGDGGAADSVVTVANSASPAAITVVSTAVSPGTAVSPAEGCTASTVIGNICYVAVNGAFGAAEDAILAIDTNSGSAPAAPATVVVGQASIEAATGASGGNANMGPLTNDGTNVWVADSAGGGTSDDIWSVNPGTGVITLQVAATDTEADLGATDVGYTGMTIAGDGGVWAFNGFGSGAGDDGVLKLTSVGGGMADTFLFDEATIDSSIGGGGAGVSGARMAFSATTNNVLFANQGGNAEGIVTIDQSVPVELSVFSAD